MSVLVGKKAPDFNVAAVLGNGEIVESFTLSEAIKGKYGLVFFYPLDFTFVCPSELIALDHRIPEFQARNVEVIGVSIDSHFTHNAWRNTPVDKGGIGAVKYTLAADTKHEFFAPRQMALSDKDLAPAGAGCMMVVSRGTAPLPSRLHEEPAGCGAVLQPSA